MKIGTLETGRVHLRDCLEGMKALPENSIDTICTDPPYGLSDDSEDIGKVFVATFFDVVLPDYKQLVSAFGDHGEFTLPSDRASLLRLMDGAVWEKSGVAMPEGPVDFNDRVVFWDEEIKDADVPTDSVSSTALIEKLDAARFEEGPHFFLNLRPGRNAAFRDGSCGGMAQFGNGRFTVPIVISLDSCFAGFLCTLSPSGPGLLSDLIGLINDPAGKPKGATAVMTSSGAELRAMLTFDLAGGTMELLPASSAAKPDFVCELRCTQFVGARPAASRLPSMFQPNRVCVVGDAANRACSICLHSSIVSQTRKRRGGFMGKNWDHGVPGIPFWTEAIRVAKPGAILLAFGGTRTFHRLACAIEDAGWELRDNIGYPNSGCPWLMAWVFGSGFPKSLAIDKAIDEQAFRDWLDAHPEEKAKYLKQMQQAKGDSKATGHVRRKFRKAAGTLREVTGRKTYPDGDPIRTASADSKAEGWSRPWMEEEGTTANRNATAPATEAAKVWDGWGTSLKPAWEPIIVAMKPLDGTFAENAEKWGVAGLWIDGGRIEGVVPKTGQGTSDSIYGGGKGLRPAEMGTQEFNPNPGGRWPANVIHDGSEEVVGRFPKNCTTGDLTGQPRVENKNVFGKAGSTIGRPRFYKGDTGSASRFFYCAKASRRERNAGCEGMEERKRDESRSAGQKAMGEDGDGNPYNRGAKPVTNHHPTVKPLALMRHLVRLTKTPTGGGVVLDPFAGSGTTGMACKIEGREFIGFEKESEYVEIANRRIPAAFDALEPDPGPRVKDLPGQKMLFEEP